MLDRRVERRGEGEGRKLGNGEGKTRSEVAWGTVIVV